MPWYYAGPEAKPVGPVSAEQLQALCASGTITPETFVIEHTGPGAANLAWKRYREAFPPTPDPASAPAPHPILPPAPVQNPSQPGPANPLFPSAVPAQPGPVPYPASPAAYPPMRPTNIWCAWGFALALIGFCSACVCLGIIPAGISVILCIVGLAQVQRNREQGGQGLAIAGLIFSGVALIISILIIASFVPSILKAHGLTVTEQTSNDSE
jgi:hypothetical protein